MSSVYINFPWSEYSTTENFITDEQKRDSFRLILKAIKYKMTFEYAKEKREAKQYESYNLLKVAVFNEFVNDIYSKLVDPVTREYVLSCVRAIRDANFKKSNVKTSFITLYNMMFKDKLSTDLFIEFVTNDDFKFIDILNILETCKNVEYNTNNPTIVEIMKGYKNYVDNNFENIRV